MTPSVLPVATPRPHHDRVVSVPAVASRHQIDVQAPAACVWRWLVDIEAWPRWHAAVQSARCEGPFEVGTAFVWQSGGLTIRSRLEWIEPGRCLVWRGRTFGTRALHVWHLQPIPGGVRVVTEEQFDGWLPRLLRGPMQRMLERSLVDWLAALKQRVEAPTPGRTA